LIISNGGQVVANEARVGDYPSNTFNNATNLAIGQSYAFAPGSATNWARLELVNGAAYRGGTLTIGSGGSLCVTGASATVADLTLAPGSRVELALGASNNEGRVTSQGAVSLAGELDVRFGAAPSSGERFVVLTAPSAGLISGTFATVTAMHQGTPYPVTAIYGDTNVTLQCIGLTRGALLRMN
jgi:hypothetical protein